MPRRVSTGKSGEQTPRLRGAERRLSGALEQLRSGVPLNWGQVEDDPELATLARLQQAGEECRLAPVREPSAQLKADLVERLAPMLPKPQEKQERTAPKTMAGFSENVQVLTQVDEDVRINVNWASTILRGVLVIAALVLLVWGLGTLLKANSAPTFTWIQVRKGSEPITRLRHVVNQDELPCRVVRAENPNRPGYFVPVQSLRDAQAAVDYNIPLVPDSITVPVTYTFQLLLASVDPCEGNTLRPSDPAALVSLQYSSSRRAVNNAATPSVSSRPPGIRTTTASFTMFAAHEQLTAFDLNTGDWKEVSAGDTHGIYWRGGPYRDQAGVQWMGDVSVMLVEHEDTVVTIVGAIADGITEEMLTAIVRSIVW